MDDGLVRGIQSTAKSRPCGGSASNWKSRMPNFEDCLPNTVSHSCQRRCQRHPCTSPVRVPSPAPSSQELSSSLAHRSSNQVNVLDRLFGVPDDPATIKTLLAMVRGTPGSSMAPGEEKMARVCSPLGAMNTIQPTGGGSAPQCQGSVCRKRPRTRTGRHRANAPD